MKYTKARKKNITWKKLTILRHIFFHEGRPIHEHNTQTTNCGEGLEISPKEPANASPRSTAGEEPKGRRGGGEKGGGCPQWNRKQLSSLLIPPRDLHFPSSNNQRTNSVLTTWYWLSTNIGRVVCVGSSQELILLAGQKWCWLVWILALFRLFHCGEESWAFLPASNTRQDEDCVDDFIVRVAFCHVGPTVGLLRVLPRTTLILSIERNMPVRRVSDKRFTRL